jgi:glutaredoxin
MSKQYLVIGKETCPYCVKAKELLDANGLGYHYAELNNVNPSDMKALKEIAAEVGKELLTVPQIFKYKKGGGLTFIGGYIELSASLSSI